MTRYSRVIEADAEKDLVNGVRVRKGLCFKLKFLGIMGAPDRLVLLPTGRFFFVELKKLGGKLEPSQEIMFPKLLALGFRVHVLEGQEQVADFFNQLDRYPL
jgi:hypothetical protein